MSTNRGHGEAGRKGPQVRSDCWIGVELKARGGITLSLRSKVAGMYGRSIEDLVLRGCRVMGLDHAAVTIEDQGALPFTLAARLEAAVRRAGHEPAEPFSLPAKPWSASPVQPERLRRSRLYLPGNEPKFFINAGLHEPDGVILDLEDSVAPAEKDAARCLVREALRAVDFRGAERMVRINQGQLGLEDLDWVVPHGVHLILIPKVEEPAQVAAVDERIAEVARRCGRTEPVLLMPIVESAKGAWLAYDIAEASPRVVALAIGLEDYTADIGAARTLEGRESFWARSQVVNGARAAGVQPIDTVFSDVADMDGLRASVREAKAMGFVGKGCIHPRQIPVVHEALAPDAAEIAKAQQIVLAFEEAQRQGLGVVSLGTKMIDPPVVKRAQAALAMALRTGALAADWREPTPCLGPLPVKER